MADWEARALWFGLGAGAATLVGYAIREPAPPPEEPVAAVDPVAPAQAHADPVHEASPQTERLSEAATPVRPPPPPPPQSDPPPSETSPPSEASPPSANASPSQDSATAADPGTAKSDEANSGTPPPDTAAPEMPLPRMPGMNQVRAKDRWDTDDGSWHLTRTWDVPAPAATAKDFYQSALDTLGMRPTVANQGPDDEHDARYMVKGRAGGDHVQVAIRQAAGDLRTRVRILWRSRG